MSQYPAAPKVQAASLTAAVSGAALWLMGRYAFRGNVPDGIASMIYLAVPGVLAYAAGWLAPHQDRAPPVLPSPYVPPSNVIVPGTRSTYAQLPAEERESVQSAVKDALDAEARRAARRGGRERTVPPAQERLHVPGDPEPPPGM